MSASSIGRDRATILVVDDNDSNRLLAQSTLEDEDYRVVLARGGREALEVFAREQPDCVVLDAAMVLRVDAAVRMRRLRTELEEHHVARRRQRDGALRRRLQGLRLELG